VLWSFVECCGLLWSVVKLLSVLECLNCCKLLSIVQKVVKCCGVLWSVVECCGVS